MGCRKPLLWHHVVPPDDHQLVEENCARDGNGVGENLLVRAGTAQETSLLGNPLSARKMGQVCIACAIGISLWIDMQHYSRDFPPVGALAFGLQKARVRHDMLLVIWHSALIGWRDIRDVRIKRWF